MRVTHAYHRERATKESLPSPDRKGDSVDHNDMPMPDGLDNPPTWEMIDALEEVLDHWEVTHSPLDDMGLQKYMLARRGLNYLRAQLPEPSG